MILHCLGSSSKGNGYILEAQDSALIIECGVPFNLVRKKLNSKISKISGAVASHSHGDHSKYIQQYLSSGIQVSSHQELKEELNINHHNYNPIESGINYTIGDFKIRAFDLKHDVRCFGYLISHPDLDLTVFISDTHYCPYKFPGLKNMILESNYSNEILSSNVEKGHLEPFLMSRIQKSHMSFEIALKFIKTHNTGELEHIVLTHLSDGNSSAEMFKETTEGVVGKSVYIADNNVSINIGKEEF